MRFSMSTLLSRCIFPVIAVLSLLGIASPAQAGGYIKFDGVDGESKDPGHDKWSDLESFGQLVKLVPGKPQASISLGDVKVEMPVDAATEELYEAAEQGIFFPAVFIDLCSDQLQEESRGTCYLQYKLENVKIVSYETRDGGDGSIAMELSYDSAERNYIRPLSN